MRSNLLLNMDKEEKGYMMCGRAWNTSSVVAGEWY